MHAQQLAHTGHNNPPSDIEMVRARLAGEEKEIRDNISAVTKEPLPAQITDELQAGLVTERIKRIKSIVKKVSDTHKEVKDPYLACGKEVDSWKNKMGSELDRLIADAETPLSAFLDKRAEEERNRRLAMARAEQEKAEKLAAEAAAHQQVGLNDTANELLDAAVQAEGVAEKVALSAMTAKSNELVKSRSAYGSTASQRVRWVAEIIDVAAVDIEKIRTYFTIEEIQKALNAFVRNGGRECAGVRIEEKAVGLNIK